MSDLYCDGSIMRELGVSKNLELTLRQSVANLINEMSHGMEIDQETFDCLFAFMCICHMYNFSGLISKLMQSQIELKITTKVAYSEEGAMFPFLIKKKNLFYRDRSTENWINILGGEEL